MSNFNWEKAPYIYEDCDLIADLSTEDEETITALFGAEIFDGEIDAEFVIQIGRESYSTNNTADWPMIEKFIPRSEWPEEMFAGQHGPKDRTPDAVVQKVIDELKKQIEQDRLDDEAYEAGLEEN
nr:MAG TPA: hypothetical protein [Bacteriophage sp.]